MPARATGGAAAARTGQGRQGQSRARAVGAHHGRSVLQGTLQREQRVLRVLAQSHDKDVPALERKHGHQGGGHCCTRMHARARACTRMQTPIDARLPPWHGCAAPSMHACMHAAHMRVHECMPVWLRAHPGPCATCPLPPLVCSGQRAQWVAMAVPARACTRTKPKAQLGTAARSLLFRRHVPTAPCCWPRRTHCSTANPTTRRTTFTAGTPDAPMRPTPAPPPLHPRPQPSPPQLHRPRLRVPPWRPPQPRPGLRAKTLEATASPGR